MGNPWARSQPHFNKDRIQRNVEEAKRLREKQTPSSWQQPIEDFNKEAEALHKYLKGMQDRFRPSDSGSPKAMGNDNFAGNMAKLAEKADKFLKTMEETAKHSHDLSGFHMALNGIEVLMAAVLIAQRLARAFKMKPRPTSRDVQDADAASKKADTMKKKTEAAVRAAKKKKK